MPDTVYTDTSGASLIYIRQIKSYNNKCKPYATGKAVTTR